MDSSKWIKFDDSFVSEASISEVLSSQAYCLIYKRKFEKRQLSIHDDDSRFNYAISRQWMNSWKHLSDPGPINSSELKCPHGLFLPDICGKGSPAALYVDITENSFKELANEFGIINDEAACLSFPVHICEKCSKEHADLEDRRRSESLAVEELDSRHVKEGEHWQIIDSRWLRQFFEFRSGKRRLPPGSITNDCLLEVGNDPQRPRPGLIRNIHYSAVNQHLWDYLFGRYGGGPSIPRSIVDIYSKPIGIPDDLQYYNNEDSSPRKMKR